MNPWKAKLDNGQKQKKKSVLVSVFAKTVTGDNRSLGFVNYLLIRAQYNFILCPETLVSF